jgi:hypothetical protein
VRVDCARPRDLARALLDVDGVTRLELGDGFVEAETRAPDRLYDAIPIAARAAGLHIGALTSPDNNIQAVFEYLTEKRT